MSRLAHRRGASDVYQASEVTENESVTDDEKYTFIIVDSPEHHDWWWWWWWWWLITLLYKNCLVGSQLRQEAVLSCFFFFFPLTKNTRAAFSPNMAAANSFACWSFRFLLSSLPLQTPNHQPTDIRHPWPKPRLFVSKMWDNTLYIENYTERGDNRETLVAPETFWPIHQLQSAASDILEMS